MNSEEWKDWYKEFLKDWKEGYKKAIDEWKDKFKDWSGQTKSSAAEVSGQIPHDIPVTPPMPPMPTPMPMPTIHIMPPGRLNVVASRIGDDELRLIDMLTEAGLFNTRSEAVAYLVAEGIKARKDVFDKVSSSLEEIRRMRRKAEEQVTKLKEEIGLTNPEQIKETEEPEEPAKRCQKCGRDLSDLPEDITICPYCGTKLKSQ
jgi:rubrerythrin